MYVCVCGTLWSILHSICQKEFDGKYACRMLWAYVNVCMCVCVCVCASVSVSVSERVYAYVCMHACMLHIQARKRGYDAHEKWAHMHELMLMHACIYVWVRVYLVWLEKCHAEKKKKTSVLTREIPSTWEWVCMFIRAHAMQQRGNTITLVWSMAHSRKLWGAMHAQRRPWFLSQRISLDQKNILLKY
jgi:hypothetical protein